MEILKALPKIIGGIIVFALFIYILLYFLQDKIVFHPKNLNQENANWIQGKFPKSEMQLRTADGKKLQGWFIKKGEEKAPLLIYYGGNAEEISWFIVNYIDKFKNVSVASFNYRGYGSSEGKPSEDALFSDALLIYDALAEREDVDPENIFVMGRSLGTGVAVHVASKREVRGVILTSAYDSVKNIAQANYPLVPIPLLLKHKFDSIAKTPLVTEPSLFLIASEDRTIPPSHTEKLMEKWGGKKEKVVIEGANHDTIVEYEKHWQGDRKSVV